MGGGVFVTVGLFGFEADVDDAGAVGDDLAVVALVVGHADALARVRRRHGGRAFGSVAENGRHHVRVDRHFVDVRFAVLCFGRFACGTAEWIVAKTVLSTVSFPQVQPSLFFKSVFHLRNSMDIVFFIKSQ